MSPVEPPAASLEPDDGGLSFEEFMRREHRRVMGLLYAMTGDWHAAEDLTQDAFAEAARRWPQVSSLNRPGAWLCRVAINKLHRWRRRRGLEESAIERDRSGIRDQLDVPSVQPTRCSRNARRVRGDTNSRRSTPPPFLRWVIAPAATTPASLADRPSCWVCPGEGSLGHP